MSELSHIDINDVPYDIKDAYTRQALSRIEQAVSNEQQARLTGSIVGCYLDGTNQRLNFTNASGNVVAYVSTATFLKDGMVNNVRVDGNYLLVSFNDDANKQPIRIPLSDIFNSANYYTKAEVNSVISDEHAQFVAMSVSAAAYNSSTRRIEFKNQNNEILFDVDATPFIKDGMVDTVSISGGNLVITFNTDAGKESIRIPITDIFNPENYYNKTDVDSKVSVINGNISSINTDIEEINGGIETLQGNIQTLNQYVDARTGYFVCESGASEAAKTINATGFVLTQGGSIKVLMQNANTAINATLNISSTGAKALYYAGERVSSSNSWEAGETVEVYYDGTSYYANNVAGGSGNGDGAFDVSVKYPTSGVDGGNTYTLEGALAVLNANLSASKKKGGMSIKFVQTYDNKYVQYRLMSTAWSTVVTNWQGVDDIPKLNSNNLITSGAVEKTNACGVENINAIYINGYLSTQNNTIVASDTSGCTQPIHLLQGDIIVLYTRSSYNGAIAVVENGDPISVGSTIQPIYIVAKSSSSYDYVSYNAPSECYVILSFFKEGYKIEKYKDFKFLSLLYSPIVDSSLKRRNLNVNCNLEPKFLSVEDNYQVRRSGKLEFNSYYSSVEYDVSGLSIIAYSRLVDVSGDPSRYGIAFLNSDKTTTLSFQGSILGNEIGTVLSFIPVPQGAKYARVTFWKNEYISGRCIFQAVSKDFLFHYLYNNSTTLDENTGDFKIGDSNNSYSCGDKLIKLYGWSDSRPTGIQVNDVYYNSAYKKLYKIVEGSPDYKHIPYYKGAIYQYDNNIYIWDGSDLINIFDNLLYYNYLDNHCIVTESSNITEHFGFGLSDFIDVSAFNVGDVLQYWAGVTNLTQKLYLTQYKANKSYNNSAWVNNAVPKMVSISPNTKYVRVSFKKETNAYLKDANGNVLFKWTPLMNVGGTLLDGLHEEIPSVYPMEVGYKKTQQQTNVEFVTKGAIPYRNGTTTNTNETCRGVIYSETMETDKRVGWDVSLLTYVTAINNPYSLIYTENISATRSRSAYGIVYHGDHNSGAYYGSVCNTFALMGCSPLIPYTTPQINGYNGGAIRGNNLFELVYDQSIRGLQLMDLLVMPGHVKVVTKLFKDSRNTNKLVQLSEENGVKAVNNSLMNEAQFEAFKRTGDYRVFRFKELYKNIYYEKSPVVELMDEITPNFVFNNDICTIYGDYACIKEDDILHISYWKGNYTSMEIYKNDTLLETIVLAESADVHDVDLSSKGYTYGMYKARLTNGTDNSDFTYWEIINIEMSLNGNTLTFSSENGTPLYWEWCIQNGGSYRPVIITQEDIDRGSVDVSERSDIYNYCLKVHVEGDYGRVAGVVLNNQ